MKDTPIRSADLISRSGLGVGFCNPDVFENKAYAEGWNSLIKIIKEAPAVDAEPVRRARWQFEARGKDGRTETPVCSGCGATPKYYVPRSDVGMQVPPHCHECGCKMDKVVKYETD